MAATQKIFFDGTKANGRVQVRVDLAADADEHRIDISGFGDSGETATVKCRVQVERIRWCQASAGVIVLGWDSDEDDDNDELIMTLYGRCIKKLRQISGQQKNLIYLRI